MEPLPVMLAYPPIKECGHMQKKRAQSYRSDLKKIHKITDFSKAWDYDKIPDPYYGGKERFELVLDLPEDSCEGQLENFIYSK